MSTRVTNWVPDIIKDWTPQPLKRRLKRSSLYLDGRAEVTNIYHCCTHKSASQWVRGLLGDPITYRYSGLEPFHYQTEWMDGHDPRPVTERYFEKQFPRQTVATPLYLHYDCFRNLKKPRDYRAFFVLRDPRDVVVSWYFSMRNSHPENESVKQVRKDLRQRSKFEGLQYSIDWLSDFGLFDAQRSWTKAKDSAIKVVTYEELTGPDQFNAFRELFNHLTVPIPDRKLKELLDKHSFEKKSGGRSKGEEDKDAHHRKGVSGDWRNHFDYDMRLKFKNATDRIASEVGYDKTVEDER